MAVNDRKHVIAIRSAIVTASRLVGDMTAHVIRFRPKNGLDIVAVANGVQAAISTASPADPSDQQDVAAAHAAKHAAVAASESLAAASLAADAILAKDVKARSAVSVKSLRIGVRSEDAASLAGGPFVASSEFASFSDAQIAAVEANENAQFSDFTQILESKDKSEPLTLEQLGPLWPDGEPAWFTEGSKRLKEVLGY